MLTLVPTPIGNLKDISLRSIEAIKSAKIVLCEDTRVSKKLLSLLMQKGILPYSTTPQDFLDSKHFHALHSHNEKDFFASVNKDFFNENVIYLSDAGMPCISDPGASLIAFAIKHHINFSVLPGSSALNVAFCSSGIESTPFMFLGFLPHKLREREAKLLQCSSYKGAYSVICYESPHRLLATLADIKRLLPETHLALHKELTKLHEKHYFGRASEILESLKNQHIRGEWVIVMSVNNESNQSGTLSYEEALGLDIAPKIKAKILSKISGESVKVCYERLLEKGEK